MPVAAARANQSLPVWRVARQHEIGRTGLGLSTPIDAVVAQNGAVAILDQAEPYLRVHGAKGAPVAELVRKGGGPGELRNPIRMGWRGDSIWIFDANQRRLTFFSMAGKYLASRTFSYGALPGTVGVRPIAILPNGGSLVVGTTLDEVGARSEVTIPIAVIGPQGGSARPVLNLVLAHQMLELIVSS